MRSARLYLTLAAAVLALGATPAVANAAADTPSPPGVRLVALHFGHSGFGRGGGLFGRSNYGRRGFLGGGRVSRRGSLLSRIGHALLIGYLLHLLFSSGGFGWIILLLIIGMLLLAHRRRRRARAYYAGQGGAWR